MAAMTPEGSDERRRARRKRPGQARGDGAKGLLPGREDRRLANRRNVESRVVGRENVRLHERQTERAQRLAAAVLLIDRIAVLIENDHAQSGAHDDAIASKIAEHRRIRLGGRAEQRRSDEIEQDGPQTDERNDAQPNPPAIGIGRDVVGLMATRNSHIRSARRQTKAC